MRPLRHRVADAIGNTKARKGKSKLELADAAIGALGFTREDVELLGVVHGNHSQCYDETECWALLLADRIEETLPADNP